MLYTIPDYYKEFQCIADKCEDTCCAGWQIVIDKKTLKKYKQIKGSFRGRMFRSINWFTGTFRQDKEKRCAFLNERNLCDLYLSQGEEGFCKTCRNYPRHIEEFEGVREITLSISCPEVARILMERKTPVTFLTYEKEGEEEYDDFDPFFFSILEDARKEMISILQNRSISIQIRTILILGMAHDMQGRIKRQEMFDCFSVIEKYGKETAENFAKQYIETQKNKQKGLLERKLFEKLYDLEFLREDWNILLQETEALLYGKTEDAYMEIERNFVIWKSENPDMEICMEQLLVYFLFTYFPGAVYDGEVYAKVQMTVFCVCMIYQLWMARWLKNEKMLDKEEMTDLVYRFSRELEHSDKNLKIIEQVMEKKWFLLCSDDGLR